MKLKASFKKRLNLIVSIFNRGVGAGIGYLISIYISNMFGATSMGVYYLFISWKNILGNIFGFGYPLVLLKRASIEKEKKFGLSFQEFLYSFKFLLCLWAIIIILTVIFIPEINAFLFLGKLEPNTILLLITSGIFYALIRVSSSYYKGIKKTNLAILLEFTLISCAVLVILFLFKPLIHKVETVILLYTLILAITAVAATIIILIVLKQKKNLAESKTVFFTKEQWALFGNNSLTLIQTSGLVLLLPWLLLTEEIGVFGAAQRTVAIAFIPIQAIASYFSPRFANSYSKMDKAKLKSLLLESQIWSIITYLPFFLVFFFWPELIMGVFGEDFIPYANILVLLSVGQVLNSATGPVGFFLNMINKERKNLFASMFTFIFGFGLMVGLGLWYGIYGVAIGHASSKIISNVAKYIFAIKALNEMPKSV